jgi:hypothetical protein
VTGTARLGSLLRKGHPSGLLYLPHVSAYPPHLVALPGCRNRYALPIFGTLIALATTSFPKVCLFSGRALQVWAECP